MSMFELSRVKTDSLAFKYIFQYQRFMPRDTRIKTWTIGIFNERKYLGFNVWEEMFQYSTLWNIHFILKWSWKTMILRWFRCLFYSFINQTSSSIDIRI